MSKVLITTSSFAQFDATPLDLLKQNDIEIVLNPYGRKMTTEELTQHLKGVDATIAGTEKYTSEILSQSDLKCISRVGSGLTSIDLDAAKKSDIEVCFTPDAPVDSVAELALAGLLSLLRKIPQQNTSLKNNEWKRQQGFLLKGKTVAIVGCGRIGQRFAQLLAPFEVTIIGVDPKLTALPHGFAELTSLQNALTKADILSFHVNTIDCLLGATEFNACKNGMILLNGARGELLDEKALTKALDSGQISAAWLDVFNEEPYSGTLQNYEQVIMTPHIGSFTTECRMQMELEATQNLINFFNQATIQQ